MDRNITEFGAIGDGVTVNTKAIQSAIDQCATTGGGRVTVPSGTFICGTIYLRNNVELFLETASSVLKASSNYADYNPVDAYVQNAKSIAEKTNGGHFILAVEAENVSITGHGILDGSGDVFFEKEAKHHPNKFYCFWPDGMSVVADNKNTRPAQMVCFIESKNILLNGITIRNSPYWTVFLHGCDQVRIHQLRIDNPSTRLNGDGIDIDCTSNVTVSDCIISTGDDAITLRGSNDRLKNKSKCTENVVINNCILTSGGANALRVGVGNGLVRNALFSNLILSKSVAGIHIVSKYADDGKANGTTIDNIRFQNIIGSGLRIPVFINSGFSTAAGISNITISDCRFDLEHTCGIVGNGIAKLSNIVFRNLIFNIVNRLPGIDSHEIDCQRYDTNSPSLDTVLIFANTDIVLENVKLEFTPEIRSAWKHDMISGENVNLSGNYHK